MGCSQTCCLADHRLNEGGVQTALPAVLPGATRISSRANAVLTVSKIVLQAAVFGLHFALSPVPTEDGASHGTKLVGVTLRFGLNNVPGLTELDSGWLRWGAVPLDGLECQGAQCPAEGRCQTSQSPCGYRT